MAQDQTSNIATGIKLQCLKCGERMNYSCTEPDKPGFVHHIYECRQCRSTQSFVTAI